RREDAIDHETRRAPAFERKLADGLDERKTAIQRLLSRVIRADNLHQRQLGNRIEEVQADETLGAREPVTKVLEPDAGCIGCEDGVGLHRCLERRVEFFLGIGILEYRLYDEIRLADAFTGRICPEPV